MDLISSADNELQSVMEIASGFWRARTLFSAVELGLFTLLKKQPLAEASIRAELGLAAQATGDFLDALVALGMLIRDGDEYRNSAAAEHYLDRDAETYVGGFLLFMGHSLYPAWSRLTELLRSGSRQEGVDSFGEWYKDADQVRGFMDAMDSVSAPVTAELVKRPEWTQYTSFVDLGGARGNLAANLVRHHPHLVGHVVDLPALKPFFEEHMATFEVAGKIEFHGGDFRTDPLPPVDVAIFGHVLHDWDEASRVLLIKRAYEATKPGGMLLIYEELLDDDRRGPARTLLMSLNMKLVRDGGAEFTAAQCREWLSEAGFTDVSVERLTATERLIKAYRK